MALSGIAATGGAQTNPAGVGSPPQAQVPAIEAPAAPPPLQMPANLPQIYGQTYPGYYEYASGFPYRQIEAVPAAAERSAVTRTLLRQAQANFDNAYRNLRREFEKSEQFAAGSAEERQAFDAYAAARDAALRRL
ncbi:MAG TPA: hypothetical protein VK324_16570, partial [Tepidisphaeraceae bacterium]|nr:hypothetical protein [Tepidisphaeraceae bacterium]